MTDISTITVAGVTYDVKDAEARRLLENLSASLSSTEKALLLSLFKNAVYTADMSATISQLEKLWSGSGDDSGGEVSVTDDGNGNLTVTGLSVTDDGNGNLTVTGATATDDGTGNITVS